jgi:prophage regulatory protein
VTTVEGQVRILREPEVSYKTNMTREMIRRLENAGQFPKRIKLSKRAVGWIESEIDAWIEAKMKERNEQSRSKTV